MSTNYPRIKIFGTMNFKLRASYIVDENSPKVEVTIGGEKWQKMPNNKLRRAIELKAVIYAGKIMHEAQELTASLVKTK